MSTDTNNFNDADEFELPEMTEYELTLHDTLTENNNNNTGSERYQYRTAVTIAQHIADITPTLELDEETGITTAQFFNTVQNDDLISGNSLECALGACLRLASIHTNNPRPLAHIAEEVDEPSGQIRTKLSKFMPAVEIDYTPVEPEDYIDYIANCLDLSEDDEVRQLTHDVITAQRETDESELYGKSPISMTASAMYAAVRIAGDRRFTQTDIGNACDVSSVSIRNKYNDLLDSYNTAN